MAFFPHFCRDKRKKITSISVPICCPSSDVWPCFISFHLFTLITVIPFDFLEYPCMTCQWETTYYPHLNLSNVKIQGHFSVDAMLKSDSHDTLFCESLCVSLNWIFSCYFTLTPMWQFEVVCCQVISLCDIVINSWGNWGAEGRTAGSTVHWPCS